MGFGKYNCIVVFNKTKDRILFLQENEKTL